MTTLKKSLLILGVGSAAVCLTLGGAWVVSQRGSSYFTDGHTIHAPAAAAPVRSILWQPATPLPGSINSTADEYEPRISADGTLMVFVRGKPGANTDLFQSKWTPDGWSEPAPIAAINTQHDELGPELSRDGKTLYFYSDRPGGLGGYDIWVAQASDDGWGTPVNLGPNVNTAANEYGPALTPDGLDLFFASNRPRPGEPTPERESWSATVRETRDRHDYDLYVVRLGDSGAEAAEAVSVLNTHSDEGAPAISPIGDFIYFASDRPRGHGGFDIYRARRDGPSIATPENLGDAINSTFSDLDPALSMDGFRLHFSSNRPAVPPSSDAAQQIPGEDYGVWVSSSREVYRQSEASKADFGDLLASILPWLLLLLLALLLALILPRLWLDQRMKARFRRLSLLAQCLLVSLALHILIASLLALWKVGNQISHYIAEQGGGGTRVVLASSSGDGDGFATQLRGELTTESATPGAPEISAADLAAAAIESAALKTDAAPTSVREAAPITTTETPRADSNLPSDVLPTSAPSEPRSSVAAAAPASSPAAAPVNETALAAPAPADAAPAARPSAAILSAPTASIRPDATPILEGGRLDSLPSAPPSDALASTPSAPATTSRLPAAGSSTLSSATPAAPSPQAGSATEAQLAAPSAAAASAGAPAGVATGPVTAQRVEVGVGRSSIHDAASAAGIAPAAPDSTPGGAAASTPIAPVLAAPTSELASGGVALPSAGNAPNAGNRNEATLTGSASLAGAGAVGPAAPASGQLSGQGTIRTNPGATTTSGADAARIAVAGSGSAEREVSGASSPPGTAMGTPAPALAIGDVSLPGAGPLNIAKGGGGASEATLSGNGTLANIGMPGPATPVAGVPGVQGTVRTNPGATTASEGTRASLAIPAPGAAGAAGPGASAPVASPQLPGGPGLSLSLGLPVAEEPPAPKETFAQRAPEIRTEILDKMGGSADTERAVGRALDWFTRHQETDGRWSGRHFDDRCRECGGPAEIDSDAAMTGLALLCYLGAGHTHDKDGPYRAVVSKGLDFLLAREEPSGDVRRGETMYSQSIATVALCEAYAMTRDKRVGDAAKRAVQFMCEGVKRAAARGNRQDDRSRADDTSVLGWQVMAMESARRAGIDVPDITFRSATSFLDKVSTRRTPGKYAYAPGDAPSAAMTAEAMFVQQLMGHTRNESRMQESAAFILQTPPRWKDGAATYYWYYATLALFQHQGDAWKQWNTALVPELLANQRSDAGATGSWDPQDQWSRMGGRIYQTAVCTLSLEVYYRYKPAGTTTPRPE